MLFQIEKIVKLYTKFPEYKGKVFVETPFGKKRILEARCVEKQSVAYILKTKSFELIGSPLHKVFSNNQWVYIKDLKKGDSLITINGQEKIICCNELVEKHDLFDIQVAEVEQYYSNGILSHNSSFLESIPFALFGETHKSIKKEQILNWKNKKNCEVSLDFSIGSDTYKVTRAIKPDNLSIFKNDSLVERAAHVKDYQKIIEEIVGMSFFTFCSLIHSNINSSNRILGMSKPEKRKFMEDVFGLQIYSELNTKANEKIRGLRDKMTEVDAIVNSGYTSIERTKQQIEEIHAKMGNLGNSEGELKTAVADLKELMKEYKNVDEHMETLGGKFVACEAAEKVFQAKKSRVDNKCILVDRWIKELDSKIAEAKESTLVKATFLKFAKEYGSPSEIKEKIEDANVELLKIESGILTQDGKLKAAQVALATVIANKKNKEDQLKRLQDHDECPTCGQSLKGNGGANIIDDLKAVIEQFTKEEKAAIIEEKRFSTNVGALRDVKSKLNKMIQNLNKNKDYLYSLKEKIKSDLDEAKLVAKKSRYQKVRGLLADAAKKIFDKDIQNCIIMRNETQNKLDELRGFKARLESQKMKIDALKSKIELEKQSRKEFYAIIETNKQNIINTEKEIGDQVKRKETYANLIDYLEVIKDICKDENLKQYAISSIMPYLNKQTNHYLSEVGYGFFTVIDKWLDAEIKGPGITKASYGSLSGGESRGIDLAIQFGLLDIAKIQAGRWPDMLILDEILDSSVDSKGIGKLMEIVRAKQIEDNNKIFIISHREELSDEFEADSIYYVEKENGYSKVHIH